MLRNKNWVRKQALRRQKNENNIKPSVKTFTPDFSSKKTSYFARDAFLSKKRYFANCLQVWLL